MIEKRGFGMVALRSGQQRNSRRSIFGYEQTPIIADIAKLRNLRRPTLIYNNRTVYNYIFILEV